MKSNKLLDYDYSYLLKLNTIRDMPHTNSDGDKNIDFSGLRQFTIHNPIDDDDELADLEEVKAISHPVGQH